jgi:hypothetical protein
MARDAQPAPESTNVGLNGRDGEIRVGRKVAATLKHWSKGSARPTESGRVATIEFVTDTVNEFWANYGPPTAIALTLLRKRWVYDVVSGDIRAGSLIVSLPPRSETK